MYYIIFSSIQNLLADLTVSVQLDHVNVRRVNVDKCSAARTMDVVRRRKVMGSTI